MSTRLFHQAIFVNCHVIQPIGCQECFNKLLSLIISMLIEFVNYFTFNCVSNLSRLKLKSPLTCSLTENFSSRQFS